MGVTTTIVKLQLPDIAIATPALRQEWNDLALASENLYAFYQSPAWWEYAAHASLKDHILRLRFGERPVMVHINDSDGRLAGMSGAFATSYPLRFMLKSRSLAQCTIPVIRLMGGEPLLVPREEIYVEFAKSLFRAFPDRSAIYIPGVPVNSRCWSILHESEEVRRHARLYIPDRDWARHYSVTLNRSFDEYLLKFSKKARYNLKREIKLLGTSGNGELSLVRVEHAADVALFLDGASQISSRSWQHALGPQMVNSPEERLRYERFAGQGVLRCYLLKCGERPCAFVRGFQFGDVFYYSRTGFDQNFSGYSPGRAMFCLLLEDLYTHRPPKRLNFQEGEYEYKRHFATGHVEQADMLLVRNDAGGLVRLAVSAHNAFGRSISLAKRIMHRQ